MWGEVLNHNETTIGIYEDMKFGFYVMTLINLMLNKGVCDSLNGMYKASRLSTSFQKKQPPTSRLLILVLIIGCYLKI